jgi:hypothetical protein
MTFWETYPYCAVGVILSIIIPVLSKVVKEAIKEWDRSGPPPGLHALPQPKGITGIIPRAFGAIARGIRIIWPTIRPYVIIGAFSLAVAMVIIAFIGDKLGTWQEALIAGYLWDSTIQKITGKP